ncbi:MAG: hypothetical protein M1829_003645 [Trizodia sp. TS-e1964]|nr:MAG: hypothetical protein M1829_003645 [Trizodia sp. TS-e1964]
MERYEASGIPQKLPFSKKKLPKRVIISYIFDYLIIIVLIVAFTALDAVEPFHQHFSLQNYTLQYPYAIKERVPVPLAAFLSVACPAIVITIYTLFIDGLFSHSTPLRQSSGARRVMSGKYRFKDRLWELNCGILGLLLSVGAAITITGALKNATGKPRPDLIDRCRPLDGSLDMPVFGLSNSTICTQTDNAILKDGFRSFPSGHSSTAFAGLFYLSLYLTAKLHVLDNRGEVWKTFIVLIPSIGAALIADSRIMDARHHPFDVLFGSLLGIVVAWCSYRQYFPPVSEPWRKGRAYPIRTWGREPMSQNEGSVAAEPLRTPKLMVEDYRVPDEERATPPPSETLAATGRVPPPASGENAFRKQISDSQRRRQTDYQNRPPPSVSMARNPSLIGRRAGRNDYDSSSSEDADGFELQPQYTLTGEDASRAHHRVYSADMDDFARQQDTSYGASSYQKPVIPSGVPRPAEIKRKEVEKAGAGGAESDTTLTHF